MNNKNSEDSGSYLSPGEQGLEEFMTRLESEAPLAEGELEITEYWFTDYCIVEVTDTPSGEVWGRNGSNSIYELDIDEPSSEYAVVNPDDTSSLGMTPAEFIQPADEYIVDD